MQNSRKEKKHFLSQFENGYARRIKKCYIQQQQYKLIWDRRIQTIYPGHAGYAISNG